MHAFWAVQCPHHVSEINAELPRETELNVLLNLFGQHDSLLKDVGGACAVLVCCVQSLLGTQHEVKICRVQFFENEINYLAYHVSKERVRPSKENLKAVAEFTLPQTYMEIQAFLDLVGHYWQFIKGFACITQPLLKHILREGASKKSEWVTLTEEAKNAFKTLKKAWVKAPVLAFANFDKPFILENDGRKLGLAAVLSQKQTDGQYHLVAYASWSLTTHEHNYHSMKEEF